MFAAAAPPPPLSTTTTTTNTANKGATNTPSTTIISGHSDIIHDAKMDFYGIRLATASSDKTIKIFSVQPNKENKLMATLSGHEGPVWQVSWSHPKFGSLLASCSYDGKVIVWKEEGSKFLKAKEFTFSQNNNGSPLVGALSGVSSVQPSPQPPITNTRGSSISSISWAPHEMGPMLAIACSDGKCALLSFVAEEGKWCSKEWNAHQIGSNSCSWGPVTTVNNGESDVVSNPFALLATSGCDNVVKVWNTLSLDDGPIHSLSGHSDWVRDCCWINNDCIVSASQDRTVNVWNFSKHSNSWTHYPLKSGETFHDALWAVEWDSASKILAVACGDGRISLWKEDIVVSAKDGDDDGRNGGSQISNDSQSKWVCVGNVEN